MEGLFFLLLVQACVLLLYNEKAVVSVGELGKELALPMDEVCFSSLTKASASSSFGQDGTQNQVVN